MTTAAEIRKSANAGTKTQHDFEAKTIRLASESQSLRHWDDAYSAGWSDGHKFDFADGSYLTIDGRGVIAGSEQEDDARRAKEEAAANDDGYCSIHGHSGCGED